MSFAALFPERVVVAREVPSLFGGTRTRLEDGPRRVDPITLVVDDGGLDVARLLSLGEAKGQPRRIAALCRRLADAPVTSTTAETQPLPALLSAWAKALSSSTLALARRSSEHARFGAVKAALDDAGVKVVELQPKTQQRLLVVDDAEVVVAQAGGWKTVCDAGQGAMLAAGLCHDVVAFFVEAAGKDGAECFDKHFDDVSRAWFVQRVERALRAGFGQGTVRLSGAALVPPLPSSTSRVHQLPAGAAPKLQELAQVHRQVQEKQRQALAKIVVELRLPAPRGSWWQEKLESFTVVAGDVVAVVAPGSVGGAVHDEFVRALVARGAVVDDASARVFVDGADDDADDAGFVNDAVVAPRAVGGVRATADFDVGVAVSAVSTGADDTAANVVDAADAGHDTSFVSGTGEVFEPREVELPARFAALSVRVDDVVVDAVFADAGRAAAPSGGGAAATRTTRLDVPVRHGSLVCVAWDDEEPA